MENPLVSVCTLAYNHSPFIRQCIEGVLMQKTTFPYEFLIHDDASTDETADIIREYEALYPNIIKPVYQTENQFLNEDVDIMIDFQLSKVQGKYIAICEGDDYWTDPLKLQKQVDFLETHPDFTICGGMWQELREGMTEPTECTWLVQEMANYPNGKTVSLHNFNDPSLLLFFVTVCFRRECLNIEKLKQFEYAIDQAYYAILLEQGKGLVFPECFGVYRIHQGGIWSGQTFEQQMWSMVDYYYELDQHFGDKSKMIRKDYFKYCLNLYFFELKTSQHLFKDYMEMVRFAFSGKIYDIFTFKVRYFVSKSRKHFKNYCKTKYRILVKNSQIEF